MSRPGTASDRVYAALRDEIVSWRIPAGTPLSEVELAERLGVSRTPLRAALTRLALEGLVDTSRGRTGVVTEMSADTVADLFELREALEVHAARLAAQRRDPRVRRARLEFDEAAAVLDDGEPRPTTRSSAASTLRSTPRSATRRCGPRSPPRARTSSAPAASPPTTRSGCCRRRRSTRPSAARSRAGTSPSPRPPRPCTCARRSPRSSRPCRRDPKGDGPREHLPREVAPQ